MTVEIIVSECENAMVKRTDELLWQTDSRRRPRSREQCEWCHLTT